MMLEKLNVVVITSVILVMISVMGVVPVAVSTSPIAKTGCQSQCGNVSIPYPFGIGLPDCFYNHWFEILCLQDRPYLHINQEPYEVLNVTMKDFYEDNKIAVTIKSNTSHIRFCKDTRDWVVDYLTGSPFSYSYTRNKFMLLGCGTSEFSFGKYYIDGGCSSACDGARGIDGCRGTNCCEDIDSFDSYRHDFDPYNDPVGATEYKLNFSKSAAGTNSCGSAFMVEQSWYPKNASLFSDPSSNLGAMEIPVVLDFQIRNSTPGPGFQNNRYCRLSQAEFWYCKCTSCNQGNAYIIDGCQDWLSDCSGSFVENNLKSIVVGGIFSLIIILVATICLLYKLIKRRIERKRREKRFKQNGGFLLQNYLSSNDNIMEKVRLFSGKDLNKATDNFSKNRVLGRGGQGTVYKGMLHDGKIVAIKKSKLLVNANQVEEFVNEIIILSQIDHRNVVQLFGCCLEMDVPLLVYEFIPNGTLYNLIHNEQSHYPLFWEVRMRIALEVAEALAYLHSATSVPIYHRDIKSSNILIDDKFKAKVADFGTSRNVGIDQTHLTTLVKGTFGYLDPEYFQSSQFTEKSDVYSFGVVLVELLTGLKPICYSEEDQSHINLAGRFILAIEENCVKEILDLQVIETSNEEEREAIIELSQRCLNMSGRNRPNMKDIVMVLQRIQKSQIPLTTIMIEKEKDVKLLGYLTPSSSDVSPLMSSTSF